MMSPAKSQPEITLCRGFPGSSAFTPSQFVSKLEARLRFAGISYENSSDGPLRAPRGKIPFVRLTETNSSGQPSGDPITLGDSTLIAEYLVEKGLADDLSAQLSTALKAQDLAIRCMLEERLYWFESYERFVENYYTTRSMILWWLPYPAQILVGLLAFRKMSSALDGQGTSRYTPEEIHAFRLEIWQSLDALLAESKTKRADEEPFWVLGGTSPTEADTTLFGFIASALMCPAYVTRSHGLCRSLC